MTLRVQQAFHVLKDDVARRRYDRTGKKGFTKESEAAQVIKPFSYYKSEFGLYDDAEGQ